MSWDDLIKKPDPESIKPGSYQLQRDDELLRRVKREEEQLSLYYNPSCAGHYIIGASLHVEMRKRPNWLHRTVSRWLLGWEWKDNEQQ